jgi:multidrug resistance efflux pump
VAPGASEADTVTGDRGKDFQIMTAARAFGAVVLFPTAMVRWAAVGTWKLVGAIAVGVRRLVTSIRLWVLFVLLLVAALIVYYVLSDIYTPVTTDAYLQAFVVQVAPRVEGQVIQVPVGENQAVKAGDLLFEIDRRPFQHRVDLLIAKRSLAVQQVAELESDLSAAPAEDVRLVAEEAYARVVHDQEQAIFKQEATTDRKYVEAFQKYKAAQAALERSRAQVRKAEQALAAKVGDEHALVAEVEAQLAQARLDLEWTRVYAPCDGLITDLQLRVGAYTRSGQPAMTVIDSSSWLVVANFRENALTRVREGQPAGVAFRGLPGQVLGAHVVSVGWGVSQGQGVPSGQLPDVKIPASWVPAAQRFQVRLTLDDPGAMPLRVGMTGSVAVYTEPEGAINDITRFWHRMIAWLYHL